MAPSSAGSSASFDTEATARKNSPTAAPGPGESSDDKNKKL